MMNLNIYGLHVIHSGWMPLLASLPPHSSPVGAAGDITPRPTPRRGRKASRSPKSTTSPRRSSTSAIGKARSKAAKSTEPNKSPGRPASPDSSALGQAVLPDVVERSLFRVVRSPDNGQATLSRQLELAMPFVPRLVRARGYEMERDRGIREALEGGRSISRGAIGAFGAVEPRGTDALASSHRKAKGARQLWREPRADGPDRGNSSGRWRPSNVAPRCHVRSRDVSHNSIQ